jgi:nucleoside-diphosphate-sugar epimerase
MRIVVTGGSGQLGRRVIAELSDHGHTVVSLDRVAHPQAYRPSWTVDLTHSGGLYEALENADGVVHLAAHIAPNLASDCDTFNDNVVMTYNVLRAAAGCSVRRAVIASSVAAFGFLYGSPQRTPDYLPVDEDHPSRPTDPYGLSKVVGESIADSFALRDGMSIASLRLPGVNYDLSYERIKGIMRDPGFRKNGFWSYVDVRDAAAACRLAVEASIDGHRVFNVAAATSNMREPTLELIRRFFPELKDVRRSDLTNWSGINSSRAEKELGFQAQHSWERYLTD